MLAFLVDEVLGVTEELARAAYFAGLDRIPWQSITEYEDGILRIWREEGHSGYLTVPVRTGELGCLALTTGTLKERPSPYNLLIELARGRVGLLRNQLCDWQILGLNVPENLAQEADQATELLARGALLNVSTPDFGNPAWEALSRAVRASESLCERYVQQAVAARRVVGRGKIPFWLGLCLGDAVPDATTTQVITRFANAGIGAFTWRDGEPAYGEYCFDMADRHLLWCKENGMLRGLGPLIDLRPEGLPPWVNFEQPWSMIQNAAFEFITTTVRRYRARIDFWEVAGPLNVPTAFPMPEDKLATFIAALVQTTRNLDPGATVAISIRQPWLEDLRLRECLYPAPFVVDALVRARVGLDALVLEVDLGYLPQGTFPRDALEWHRHLEYWAQLGLPLFIRFCAPSQTSGDPFALGRSRPVFWQWSPEQQAHWARQFLVMALAKPFVKGFLWSTPADFQPHEFPHSGLFDFARRPKPAVEILSQVKAEYLG